MSLIDRIQVWLKRHPNIEAALWFVAALACIVILAWFLALSGFGEPPGFVCEQL